MLAGQRLPYADDSRHAASAVFAVFSCVDSEHVGGESIRNAQMMQVRHESLHISIASLCCHE